MRKNNWRKNIKLITILVMSIIFMVACGDNGTNESSPSENSSSESKVIGVVPWDMSQEFQAKFAQEAQKEIEDRGWEIVVMDPAGDWGKTYTILQDLITQDVDGIIYTAIDADAANDAVEEVQAAGIPIIDYDSLASNGGSDASVVYDDHQGGVVAAESTMEALNGKEDATIIIFEDEPAIATSGKRVNAFTDYISENYPNATIIKNRTTDRTAAGVYSWAIDMITAYPEADAFFCYWADSTMATYNALQDHGATDVYVVGYDATPEQQKVMIEEGEDSKLYASPGMSSKKMAQKSVEFLEEIFNGTYERQGPEDIFMFEPELLTVENAEDFDIDE